MSVQIDTDAPSFTRVALGIEYDGSAFNGWQIQNHHTRTIQKQLESALSFVADAPIRTICAGRTDAGVHGLNQVVHFDPPLMRNKRAWVLGTNTRLPPTVRVRWVKFVSDEFHARFSALARRYRYVIDNRNVRPAIMNSLLSWDHRRLDVERMREAAQYLVGEHDFSSYRAVHCQAKNPVRTVEYLDVQRQGELVIIDVKANAFLHHMVRNLAGVLITIGCGEAEPVWAKEVLEVRDRTRGGVTAPPHGLYFMEVYYPEHFQIPRTTQGLPFLL